MPLCCHIYVTAGDVYIASCTSDADIIRAPPEQAAHRLQLVVCKRGLERLVWRINARPAELLHHRAEPLVVDLHPHRGELLVPRREPLRERLLTALAVARLRAELAAALLRLREVRLALLLQRRNAALRALQLLQM